jgi:hypothetical protein
MGFVPVSDNGNFAFSIQKRQIYQSEGSQKQWLVHTKIRMIAASCQSDSNLPKGYKEVGTEEAAERCFLDGYPYR